jgi:hypothetical protein
MWAIVRLGRHGSPPDLLPGSRPGYLDLDDGYRAGGWTQAELGPAVGKVTMPVEVHRGVHDPGSQIGDPGSTQAAVVVQSSQVLATPEAKVAEEHDGVHVDTIQLFLDA